MPHFERTSNGRWRVMIEGVWIGTIAPVPHAEDRAWWFVPRYGAGHVHHKKPEDAMVALEREYTH